MASLVTFSVPTKSPSEGSSSSFAEIASRTRFSSASIVAAASSGKVVRYASSSAGTVQPFSLGLSATDCENPASLNACRRDGAWPVAITRPATALR